MPATPEQLDFFGGKPARSFDRDALFSRSMGNGSLAPGWVGAA